MNKGPIKEPRNVDLVLEGGDMTAADFKAFRALLRKSQTAIRRAQEKMTEQPWMDEPIPTLQQLVALQHKREDEADRKRPSLPPGILDVDESGIGGTMTQQDNAYMSAYIWTSRQRKKRYLTVELASALAREPEAPSWSKVKRDHKRKKA